MKNDRRVFIKKASVLGLGLAGSGFISSARHSDMAGSYPEVSNQVFNMSGYAAPKLDVVRVAVIGLGNRGTGTVRRLASIEGVEIKALCDIVPDKVKRSADLISPLGHRPDRYSGEQDWKKICERDDIDLVAVVTPWQLHTRQCVYAMEHGKHAYVELPAATTVDECWRLVETSERTRKHCVQMSGSCSGGISAVILNMVRQGFFGDIIHAEGAYIHDLIPRHLFNRGFYEDNWRIMENIGRSGNLYPQHGLVPILQMLDINYGDKIDYLTSVSSGDFSMNKYAKKMAAENGFGGQFVGKDFRGNMNTTIIRTVRERTIMMQHDVSTPRPNVRFDLLSGSDATYKALPGRIATSHDGWLAQEEFDALIDKYTPEIVKKFDELSRQQEKAYQGGHGYYRVTPTDWRLIDCIRTGLPVDMNVYEAAVSSVVTPLSVLSVQNRGASVNVPDFTSGAWKTNQRCMDVGLERGFGSTKLI
jgi:hypothetical protein